MKTPTPTPNPLLPFQLDPAPAPETLTAFGGLPLVAQTYRSLGLPQSVARHLHLKQRQRGLDEATLVESFVLLNAAGGDCLEDFRRWPKIRGCPRCWAMRCRCLIPPASSCMPFIGTRRS